MVGTTSGGSTGGVAVRDSASSWIASARARIAPCSAVIASRRAMVAAWSLTWLVKRVANRRHGCAPVTAYNHPCNQPSAPITACNPCNRVTVFSTLPPTARVNSSFFSRRGETASAGAISQPRIFHDRARFCNRRKDMRPAKASASGCNVNAPPSSSRAMSHRLPSFLELFEQSFGALHHGRRLPGRGAGLQPRPVCYLPRLSR